MKLLALIFTLFLAPSLSHAGSKDEERECKLRAAVVGSLESVKLPAGFKDSPNMTEGWVRMLEFIKIQDPELLKELIEHKGHNYGKLFIKFADLYFPPDYNRNAILMKIAEHLYMIDELEEWAYLDMQEIFN